jgi:hypothetical protein
VNKLTSARAILAVLVFAFASPSLAQSLEGSTIDCRFSQQFTGEIKDGKFSPVKDNSRDFVITFSGFAANGTAQMIGNVGATKVFYDVQGDTLVIAQLFGSAIKTLTTMTLPRSGAAVFAQHSRHVWFPGTHSAVISEWGGPCSLR